LLQYNSLFDVQLTVHRDELW